MRLERCSTHPPARYTRRVLKSAFTDRWYDNLGGLIAAVEPAVRMSAEAEALLGGGWRR